MSALGRALKARDARAVVGLLNNGATVTFDDLSEVVFDSDVSTLTLLLNCGVDLSDKKYDSLVLYAHNNVDMIELLATAGASPEGLQRDKFPEKSPFDERLEYLTGLRELPGDQDAIPTWHPAWIPKHIRDLRAHCRTEFSSDSMVPLDESGGGVIYDTAHTFMHYMDELAKYRKTPACARDIHRQKELLERWNKSSYSY